MIISVLIKKLFVNLLIMFGERSFELVKDVERQLGATSVGVPTYDVRNIKQQVGGCRFS